MSSQSVPMVAVRNETTPVAIPLPATIWRVECWRMFRQLQPIFWCSIGLVAVFQLLFFTQAVLASTVPALEYMQMLYEAVPYSGLLFGLGVICTLFGIEREHGYWHWRSQLPRRWRSELALQLFSTALGVSLCCLASFLLSYFLDSLTVYGLGEKEWGNVYSVNMAFLYGAVLGVPMLVIGLLASERVAPGLMLGVAATFVFEILFVLLLFSLQELGFWGFWPAWYAHATMTLLAVGVALAMYRWRWLRGQHWQWRWRAVPSDRRPVHLDSRASMLGSLAHASLRKYIFGLVLLVGLAPMVIWPFAQLPTLLFVGTFFAWVGLRAISEERRNHQILFLADRGVSVAQVWLARCVVPCLLVLVPILVIGWFTAERQFYDLGMVLYFTTALSMFSLGLMARLAFRSWAVVLFVVLILGGFGWAMMGFAYHAAGMMGLLIGTGLVVTAAGVGSYVQLRELMKSLEPRMVRIWLVANVAWIAAIAGMYPFQRAYSIPLVDVAAGAGAQVIPVKLPNWQLGTHGPLPELTPMVHEVFWTPEEPFRPAIWSALQNDWDDANNEPHRDTRRFYRTEGVPAEEAREIRERLRATALESVDYLEQRIQNPEPAYATYSEVVSSHDNSQVIGWTADLFVIAVSAGDLELARRALQLHFEASISYWYNGNRNRMRNFELVRDRDWQRLQEVYPLEELLPVEPPKAELQNYLTGLYAAEYDIPMYKYLLTPPEPRGPQPLAAAVVNRERANVRSSLNRETQYVFLNVILEGLTSETWWEQERTRRIARRSFQSALEKLNEIERLRGLPYSFGVHQTLFWDQEARPSWWMPYYEDTSVAYYLTPAQRNFLYWIEFQMRENEAYRQRLNRTQASAAKPISRETTVE